MEEIGPVFYSIVLPVLLTFVLGFATFILQRKSGSSTVEEFQKLFNEVQEERDKLKESFAKLETYKRECDNKIEEYRKQVATVLDSEMKKRKELEEENASLKELVNRLTLKLAAAQSRIEELEKRLGIEIPKDDPQDTGSSMGYNVGTEKGESHEE